MTRGNLTRNRAGADGIIKTNVRQGTSFARGVLIDGFLTDADREALYQKWDDDWGEPERFRGGVPPAISCELVCQAPYDKFSRALGKARAARILAIAQEHAVV